MEATLDPVETLIDEALGDMAPDSAAASVEVTDSDIPVVPPEPTPAHVQAHYDAIREKEREVRVLEGNYLDAKERAADAKKEFEAADKALRNLISAGPNPQINLPFPPDEATPAAEAIPLWRSAPLTAIDGLTDKLLEKLAEGGIENVGQLEDLRAETIDGRREWPKGIGPAAVTRITDAVIAWLNSDHGWGSADQEPSEQTPCDGMEPCDA